jgi:glucosamine--fructose-6-phosphate aminotransferase (isomerizing)
MNHHVPGELMIAEIHEEPTAIARLIDKELKRIWSLAEKWATTPPRFIFIAARGTSDHVALYGKYLFETMNGIPTGLAAPSVSSIYNAHLNLEGALIIGISQSGEAADVISVLEQAKRDGADTLAITNEAGSPITKFAQETILLHAKPELSVAATKTFSSSMAALLLLSAAIGRNAQLREDLERLPELIAEVLGKEHQIETKVERFRCSERDAGPGPAVEGPDLGRAQIGCVRRGCERHREHGKGYNQTFPQLPDGHGASPGQICRICERAAGICGPFLRQL